MSRSNNTELKNPATKFIEWKSEKKHFQYFDKQAEKNIDIKLPFKFLVLDTLSTIKGYSDIDKSGFWSNEIRDIKHDELIVRTKKGTCYKGLYDGLAGARDCTGSKYCQSVYIALKTKDGMEIANIQILGAALGQWIDFRKKNNIMEGAIEVSEFESGKKGKTEYNMPVFKKIATTKESDEEAKKLDKILQEYLSLYFKKPQKEDVSLIEEIVSDQTPEDESERIYENTFKDEKNNSTDLPF
jgi:hypothetical protein